jgi:hypothetical protein
LAIHFSEAGLNPLGESFEIANPLDFVVGQFDAKVIFYAGKELESLQTVYAELFEEIVLGCERACWKLEMRCGEVQHFLRGLLESGHDNANLSSCATTAKSSSSLRKEKP